MSKDNKTSETKDSGAQFLLRKLEPVVNKDGPCCPNSVLLSTEKPCVLGRALGGDVNVRILSNKAPLMISRKHATVAFVDGSWVITDNNSLNGVFINDKRIPPNHPQKIKNEDKIIFGCPLDDESQPEFEYVFQQTARDKSCKRSSTENVEDEHDKRSKKKCVTGLREKPSGSRELGDSEDKSVIDKSERIDKSKFETEIKNQEEKIKGLMNQLSEKEKAHEELAKTMEKKEQDFMSELEKQKEDIKQEKLEAEKRLQNLLEEQLRDKELVMWSEFDDKMKSLVKERDEIERNLQEELDTKLTEKDSRHKEELEKQKLELNKILAEMESERKSREAEILRNQELLDNLKNAEENEKKLGSCLEELRRQIHEKDEDLQKQQDTMKQAEETGKRSVLVQMEDEFTCMICHELFIKAVTLPCAHSFCESCLESWLKIKKDCPVCRKHLHKKQKFVKSLVLDNAVSKILENADEEVKQRRETMIKERSAAKASAAAGAAQGNRPGGVANQNPVIINLVDLPGQGQHRLNYIPNQNQNRHNVIGHEERTFRFNEFFCFRCGGRGHYARDCFN